jgi:ribosomal protein L2
MGKRIISQARGKGSHTYKVRRKAFRFEIKFPGKLEGKGKVIRLINSGGHTAPIAKIGHAKGSFYVPAFEKAFEGQEISF